jgi:hypothetical protein
MRGAPRFESGVLRPRLETLIARHHSVPKLGRRFLERETYPACRPVR